MIALGIFGIPCVFQELAIGQYLSTGGVTILGHLSPLLRGEIIFIQEFCAYYPQELAYPAWCF